MACPQPSGSYFPTFLSVPVDAKDGSEGERACSGMPAIESLEPGVPIPVALMLPVAPPKPVCCCLPPVLAAPGPVLALEGSVLVITAEVRGGPAPTGSCVKDTSGPWPRTLSSTGHVVTGMAAGNRGRQGHWYGRGGGAE